MGIIKDNITNLRPGDYRLYEQGIKNYIINGNFDVWQYNTTQITSGYGSDDRFLNAHNGSTKTNSQVICSDTERALFNATFYSRAVITSVAGVSNYVSKAQRIENVNKLAGKTVTISFWMKADTTKSVAIALSQNFGTGGTPSAAVNNSVLQTISIGTTWTKHSTTITIPSIVGKTIGTDGAHTSYTEFACYFDAGSSVIPGFVQQSGTFDIAQIQIEEGTIATPFEYRPFGLELNLSKRYYDSRALFIGVVGATTNIPINMRTVPTIAGGGTGFTSTNTTKDTLICYQTTAALQTITLSSEL